MNKVHKLLGFHFIVIVVMIFVGSNYLQMKSLFSVNQNKIQFYERAEYRFEKDEYCRKTYSKSFEDKLRIKFTKVEHYTIDDIFFSPKENECFAKYNVQIYGDGLPMSSTNYLQKTISDREWTNTSQDIGEPEYVEFTKTEKELRSWDSNFE